MQNIVICTCLLYELYKLDNIMNEAQTIIPNMLHKHRSHSL